MQDKRKFHGKLFLLICLFTLCLLFILAQNSFRPSMRGVNMPDVGLFGEIGDRIEQRTTELRQSGEQVSFRITCILKQADILKEYVESWFSQKGE